jgi:hypothetical protein
MVALTDWDLVGGYPFDFSSVQEEGKGKKKKGEHIAVIIPHDIIDSTKFRITTANSLTMEL